jgi:hypothetical protein
VGGGLFVLAEGAGLGEVNGNSLEIKVAICHL